MRTASVMLAATAPSPDPSTTPIRGRRLVRSRIKCAACSARRNSSGAEPGILLTIAPKIRDKADNRNRFSDSDYGMIRGVSQVLNQWPFSHSRLDMLQEFQSSPTARYQLPVLHKNLTGPAYSLGFLQ